MKELEMTSFGEGSSFLDQFSKRDRYKAHLLVVLFGGELELEIDFDSHRLSQYQVLMVPKGAVLAVTERSNARGCFLRIHDEFFSRPQRVMIYSLLVNLIQSRKLFIQLTEDEKEEILPYFQILENELKHHENQNQTFILQNVLLALLNKLEGNIQHIEGPNSFIHLRQEFQRFVVLLEDHYKQEKSVSFYTEQLKLTAKHLNHVLKEILDSTAQDMIIDRVILEAKRMLTFTNSSVKEIAYELGYDNPYYFSRLFKVKMEMSPDEFRKSFAE
ncbi:MAG: AraC family transcriptional regulator [Bacteroidota bacterium]